MHLLYQQVDVLVNNAGSAVRGPLMQSSVEDLSHTLDLNVKATVLLTRLLAPRIAKRGSGVSCTASHTISTWVGLIL